MNHRLQNEQGIAMVMAIMAVVVIGVLVVGVGSSAVLEHRQARNTQALEEAFGATELGLNNAIATWDTGSWNTLGVWDAANPDRVAPFSDTLSSGALYSGDVRRLNQQMFFVQVEGRSANGSARQRLGTMIRFRALTVEITAALTSRGPTTIGGNTQIDGTDTPPAGWDSCPGTQPTKSGIRVQDASDVTFQGGCSGGSCVSGDPIIEVDATIDDDTFFDYGDADWEDLVSMANIRLPTGNYQQIWPSLSGTQCNTSDIMNWGDPINPTQPCFNYSPIIYVDGDLRVSTGMGQGILVVGGDLTVAGGFEFFGIVIVRGSLNSTGTGNHLNGGVMASNVSLEDNSVLGNSIINYSSCAVTRAQQKGSVGSPLRSRGWIQLY